MGRGSVKEEDIGRCDQHACGGGKEVEVRFLRGAKIKREREAENNKHEAAEENGDKAVYFKNMVGMNNGGAKKAKNKGEERPRKKKGHAVIILSYCYV